MPRFISIWIRIFVLVSPSFLFLLDLIKLVQSSLAFLAKRVNVAIEKLVVIHHLRLQLCPLFLQLSLLPLPKRIILAIHLATANLPMRRRLCHLYYSNLSLATRFVFAKKISLLFVLYPRLPLLRKWIMIILTLNLFFTAVSARLVQFLLEIIKLKNQFQATIFLERLIGKDCHGQNY